MDKQLLKVPHISFKPLEEIHEFKDDVLFGRSIIQDEFEKIYKKVKNEEEKFYMDLISKDKYWFYRGVILEINTGLSFGKQYVNQEPTIQEMIQGELGMSILRMRGDI